MSTTYSKGMFLAALKTIVNSSGSEIYFVSSVDKKAGSTDSLLMKYLKLILHLLYKQVLVYFFLKHFWERNFCEPQKEVHTPYM